MYQVLKYPCLLDNLGANQYIHTRPCLWWQWFSLCKLNTYHVGFFSAYCMTPSWHIMHPTRHPALGVFSPPRWGPLPVRETRWGLNLFYAWKLIVLEEAPRTHFNFVFHPDWHAPVGGCQLFLLPDDAWPPPPSYLFSRFCLPLSQVTYAF